MTETHKQRLFQATTVRYIKLGPGNGWASKAIEGGKLLFGDRDIEYSVAAQGDWDAVRAHWLSKGANASVATDSTRELRDFCELGDDCLWITFNAGRLWWGFAEANLSRPEQHVDVGFARSIVGGWKSTNILGEPLYEAELSSALTKVRAYRRTVCSIVPEGYLLRIINGVPDPRCKLVEELQADLAIEVAELIKALDWTDFEAFADLLARELGWVRSSVLGGPQADIDFVAEIPALDVRGYFQVKSQADAPALRRFLAQVPDLGPERRAIFVCHTFRGQVELPEHADVWTVDFLAQHAVQHGLVAWLLQKIR